MTPIVYAVIHNARLKTHISNNHLIHLINLTLKSTTPIQRWLYCQNSPSCSKGLTRIGHVWYMMSPWSSGTWVFGVMKPTVKQSVAVWKVMRLLPQRSSMKEKICSETLMDAAHEPVGESQNIKTLELEQTAELHSNITTTELKSAR